MAELGTSRGTCESLVQVAEDDPLLPCALEAVGVFMSQCRCGHRVTRRLCALCRDVLTFLKVPLCIRCYEGYGYGVETVGERVVVGVGQPHECPMSRPLEAN